MGNALIFPSPSPSYSYRTHSSKLFFFQSRSKPGTIPEDDYSPFSIFSSSRSQSIPCLYLRGKYPSKKLIVYFHGNSEDLGSCEPFLQELHDRLRIDVLAMEYPGYGIFRGESNEQTIITAAENLCILLREKKQLPHYDPWNTILIGRSIGTGVAVHLASKMRFGAIILISPYTCIKDLVEMRAGYFGTLLMPDIFRSIDKIDANFSPLLIIHGKEDNVIPVDHAEKLYEKCKSRDKMLVIREEMTHRVSDLESDILVPIETFLVKHGLDQKIFVRRADLECEIINKSVPRSAYSNW